MAADHPTALPAFPGFLLLSEELSNAVLLYGFEILDHTHPEQSPVTRVEVLEPSTGKTAAFMAVFDLAVPQQIAFSLEEGALLPPWSATGTMGHSDASGLDIMRDG